MQNFSELYTAYTNKQLLEVILNPRDYQPEAVAAASLEFEKRELSTEESEELESSILTENKLKGEKQERSKAISRKVKSVSLKLAEAYDPVHVKGSTSEKTILYVSTFLVLVFGYMIFSQYDELFNSIRDFRFSPVGSIVTIITFLIPLVAAPLFYFKKRSGWILAAGYILYFLLVILLMSLHIFTQSGSDYQFIRSRSGITVYHLVVSFIFFSGVLFTITRANIREVYCVSDGTLAKTFLFAAVLFFAVYITL
jgi:hypothetical protein